MKTKKTDCIITDELLTIMYADGKRCKYTLNEIPKALHTRLAMHGLKQKLTDKASEKMGPNVAREKIGRVYEALKAGEWTAARDSAGMLVEALVRLGYSEDKVVTKLNKANAETKASYRKDPRVAAELAKIALERAEKKDQDGAGMDLDALFK